MTTYKININGTEVERWENGLDIEGSRFAKDFKISKIIKTNNLTRKDVLQAVTDMLYHRGKVNEEDLFDGNEDYFIFSRLENGDSEELEHGIDTGYYASYFIDVEKVERLSVSDIV